jgi:hypothetical protein
MNDQYDFTNLIELLLVAPEDQLDPSMLPLIEKWDRPTPKAVQVLEVLDKCIYSAVCTDFVVGVFQTIYDNALENEKTTHAEIEKLAVWRDL